MSRVAAFVSRYRWEMTPLVAVAVSPIAAALAAPAFDEARYVRAAFALFMAAVLAAMLPRVRRQGRPLLTVLWVLLLVEEALLGTRAVLIEAIAAWVRSDTGTASGQVARIGFRASVASIASMLLIIAIAASQARRGMRFALLLGAVYLAPVQFLGFISFIVGAIGYGLPEGMPAQMAMMTLPWQALVNSPLALAAVALIAHTVHHAEAMERRVLDRRVLILLVLAVAAMWAGFALPAMVGSVYAREWLMTLGAFFLGPVYSTVYVAVFLGLIWGFARLSIALRSQVSNG